MSSKRQKAGVEVSLQSHKRSHQAETKKKKAKIDAETASTASSDTYDPSLTLDEAEEPTVPLTEHEHMEDDFQNPTEYVDGEEVFIGEDLTCELFPVSRVKDRIKYVVWHLENWKPHYEQQLKAAREVLFTSLYADLALNFGYSVELAEYLVTLFSPAPALAFMETMEKPRPTTLRTNTLKTRRKELARLLINRQCNVDPLGDWTKVGLVVHEAPIPIGATPEYCAGYYMLQSASSLLPVMALAPQPGELVLDMAAAPGGKSTHIAQLMQNEGVLFCNDVKKDRLAALCANLQRMGVVNAIVTNFDGTNLKNHLPPLDRILLDAPCSGIGIISKDPAIKTKRSVEELKEHGEVQKKLLLSAIDLVNSKSKTGGYIVYSTCSMSIEENEAVVAHALKVRHVKVVPMTVTVGHPGFASFGDRKFHPSLTQARRVYPQDFNMDGFFYCKLKKLSDGIPKRIKKDRLPHNIHVQDWGPEKWTEKYLDKPLEFENSTPLVDTKQTNKPQKKQKAPPKKRFKKFAT